ncbi:hypothetical protein TB147_17760 [Klebsiella aerogenes]|uniref:glycosyltransferase family 9 protein n=1 Tax=Klebsiella aerogenes TaxID=548 RepID=UPI002E37C684|nr:hypothetical protein [Klebsiella aerogenes]MED7793151.1 hypothetical protein [Klebsiella aerogenes]
MNQPSLTQFRGSLLDKRGNIIAPYKLGHYPGSVGATPLTGKNIHNYSQKPFSIDYKKEKELTIINGMGVTLGDSIIGLAVLHSIKLKHPELKINIIRPAFVQPYVEEIYNAAKRFISTVHYMPFNIKEIKAGHTIVDTGNHLYCDAFHSMEMHDFFLKILGGDINDIVLRGFRNIWLSEIELPEVTTPEKEYILFCGQASTKVRSIPEKFQLRIINQLVEKHNMLICGFADINHPCYVNLADVTPDTLSYLSVIKNASSVYTCDSSAVHIAAGFNKPTICVFNTIKPDLRTRYYPHCESHYIGCQMLEGIQNSEMNKHLHLVERQYEKIFNL